MVVVTFNVDRATFDKQRNTYIVNTAAFLGVSTTRLSLEPEESGDAASGTTSVKLIILPAIDEGSDTEPTADDAAMLLVQSDIDVISAELEVQVLEVEGKSTALGASSESDSDFPVAAVIVPVVIVLALSGLACVYLNFRRNLASLSTMSKPIIVVKDLYTSYPSDVNKVPTMTKPSESAVTISGRERGYSTI